MSRVLLVDDEPSVRAALKELVQGRGWEPVLACSASEALEQLERADVLVTDFSMPEMDGLALLQAVRERDEWLPVILLTAHGSERLAVRAMKAGAYEYVPKPFDVDELALAIGRALEARLLRQRNRQLTVEHAIGRRLVFESANMRQVLAATARVAAREITVLVRGETGTGKELIGTLLHALSKRAAGPLVRFNCSAIPAELAEAELFGHVRGAFTGAVQARPGFFAQADGGTLVLDEVGELPLGIQAKLLRTLQEGEIQPVGSGRVERVDVRIVACTHRDLRADVQEGRFREDLYYRLAVVELTVPPLRDRREDIPALAHEFALRYAERFGSEDVRLAPALVERLVKADWPGNVRQLENVVARMVALSGGGEIGPDAFEATGAPAGGAGRPAAPPSEGEGTRTLRAQLDELERAVIARTMVAVRGNQSEAARRLGISRNTLTERLRRYELVTDAGEGAAATAGAAR
ncbi:sigma-54-dependent transcriptional regulator [Anaeromyxobacter dehalogenans]|uniref:Two component, sigma54 specific, transcriptional regulator, Fis family n=1 Tax=Anaeromyxobacter dehalogenans (strain 2CP-C) TaxID=290397 RepID=Q2IK30_ANADE|nr:sigma-54 dependent transcriptional regulator [Anaeromyxobacter dehalogenans]ABC82009.1 two component, sigma54 specific, transcriptional regulator, Fis family [Anaeromyxobacter dehalogenans 2CP-C]